MSESGPNSEHGTSFFKVAAWIWADEGTEKISRTEIPQNLQIVQARGVSGRVNDPCGEAATHQLATAALVSLTETNPDTRKQAAQVVEQAAEWLVSKHMLLEAVEALLYAMQDDDWPVRAQVVQALGATGPRLPEGDLRKQVIDRLCAALLDEAGLVRAVAARSLDNFQWQPGKDETAASYWAMKRIWQMCVAIGEPAIGPLKLALTDWDWTVRRGAAEALGRIGLKAIDALIHALGDDIPSVYEAAAASLGRIGSIQAASALLNHLDRLGQHGGRALGQIAEKANREEIGAAILDPLTTCLDSENPNLRVEAAAALGVIGSRRLEVDVQGRIGKILADTAQDPEWRVRAEALRSLGMVGMRVSVDELRWGIATSLLTGTHDTVHEVQKTALASLAKVGSRIKSARLRRMLIQEIGEALPNPDDETWGLVEELMLTPTT